MAIDLFSVSGYALALLFFVAAFAYSSVGLGGGSSYTALMAIVGLNPLAIPLVSLSLNLLVTSVASLNFIRSKHTRIKLVLPFLLSSMPMAYWGGSLLLPKRLFYLLLLISLVLVAIRIYAWKDTRIQISFSQRIQTTIALISGAILGLLAGIVGIGGGIFLVPLILILGLGTEKEAAACGALFIWLNSAVGLLARLQHNAINLADYVPLIVAVLLGGTLGSFMGAFHFSPKMMEKILGAIIILAIILLSRKVLLSYGL